MGNGCNVIVLWASGWAVAVTANGLQDLCVTNEFPIVEVDYIVFATYFKTSSRLVTRMSLA